ncbi:hypothetical protein [Kitasatospora brasiliensis]|uniref:hypothetical protein n=1 Tax=Kitasatospora brasiliensis TaxID=3058040 RepID=UPI00293029F5|nr:hypothetical protein [Kitasatospora sp. K002]
MISAAVVAAVVGLVPAVAQAAGPSAAGASPTTGAGSAPAPAAVEQAAKDALAKDRAAKAGARAGAPKAVAGPGAAPQDPYFELAMGSTAFYGHGVDIAVSVATDLTEGRIVYDIDWGDGRILQSTGDVTQDRLFEHLFAEVGSHRITITATEQTSKRTATIVRDVLVNGSEFVPRTPARLLDTRDGTGAPAAKAVAPYATTRVRIAGSAGIPAGVTAVALNLTVTDATDAGHLIAYASGTPQPTTSNVNFTAGQSVPTLAIVPVGADGYVELANRSGGTVDLIADVTGYFTQSAANGYTSVKPSRIADTRDGRGTARGQVAGQSTFAVQVAGQGGVPAQGVAAVALNVTVTDPKGPGHLTVFPSGGQAPSTSNLNFTTGQTVANAVIVPVGPDGRISLRNGAWAGTDVIVDVTGYYSADSEAAYLPENPKRAYDSRLWGPLAGQQYKSLGMWQPGRRLEAVVLNTTVTDTQGSGHLSVAPDPLDSATVTPTPPDSSVLNWTKGATVSNLVQADIFLTTGIDVWNRGWEPIDLIVDRVGAYDRN